MNAEGTPTADISERTCAIDALMNENRHGRIYNMIHNRKRHRKARGHLAVVDKFLSGESSAEEFERDYLNVFKRSKGVVGESLHSKLSDIFFAVEDYVPDPELRTEDTDIDEEEMTRRVRQARAELAALLNER